MENPILGWACVLTWVVVGGVLVSWSLPMIAFVIANLVIGGWLAWSARSAPSVERP